MVITYDSEEVLILGSLEERGLPRHLAQVAPLTRQRDTLHHYPSLRGLTLLTTGSWVNILDRHRYVACTWHVTS